MSSTIQVIVTVAVSIILTAVVAESASCKGCRSHFSYDTIRWLLVDVAAGYRISLCTS